MSSNHEDLVSAIYENLLKCWDSKDAKGFAALFAEDGSIVGFDGTQMNGRNNIESHLAEIFGMHETATYLYKIQEAREIGSDVVLVRAIAGMIPKGGKDINPNVNAIHSLIASKHGVWQIDLFQNTPAAFHVRHELVLKIATDLLK